MKPSLPIARVVGVDIDDTLTTYEVQGHCLQTMFGDRLAGYDSIKAHGWRTFRFEDDSRNDITKAEARRFWQRYAHTMFQTARVSPAWLKLAPQIIGPATKVYIVTARHAENRAETLTWLRQRAIPFDDLIVTDSQPKMAAMQQLNVDMVVDDKPAFFDQARQALPGVWRILMDKPYNQGVDCDFRINDVTGEVMA